MLAWNLKQKEVVFTVLEFYCPNCHTLRTYEIKPASDVDVICVLPGFGTRELTHVAECSDCKNGFDPEILTPTNQGLFRLVADTRRKLLDGTSPGSLKVRLMSDGLNEELVDKLITLALD